VPRGLYMYGGVGRGKSMLMDWFYEAAEFTPKRRTHFHAFMLDIHERINAWRKLDKDERRASPHHVRGAGDDPIAPVWVNEGVVVIATSNRDPDTLYENGLNRNLFMPFINMMPEHLIIYAFDGDTDHRLRALTAAPVYHVPLNAVSNAAVSALSPIPPAVFCGVTLQPSARQTAALRNIWKLRRRFIRSFWKTSQKWARICEMRLSGL